MSYSVNCNNHNCPHNDNGKCYTYRNSCPEFQKSNVEEATKVLEHCVNNYGHCEDCYYRENEKGIYCIRYIPKMALNVINQLQLKVKRLTNAYKQCAYERDALLEENSTEVSSYSKESIQDFVNEILDKVYWKEHSHTSQTWESGYKQCMEDIRNALDRKLEELEIEKNA